MVSVVPIEIEFGGATIRVTSSDSATLWAVLQALACARCPKRWQEPYPNFG